MAWLPCLLVESATTSQQRPSGADPKTESPTQSLEDDVKAGAGILFFLKS
jgi:hypothetical protein